MTEKIKQLRQMTGAGIMECKSALNEVEGNLEKAVEVLRKKGLMTARKKADRVAEEGRVESYVHSNAKIGVLVEVNCETDFVAKCDDFKQFTKDIAMQIAAANPLYLKGADIPNEVIEKEREIIKSQIKDKPDNVLEKIVDGKVDKFLQEVCLLEQPFIKDDKIKIKDYLNQLVGKIRENIVIKRFVRFSLGEKISENNDQK
ncbi:MAG: translation elongation factor Ts [Candidatus Kappaea frigidicola]|nr:translation elongation factor Ts [Candidatus Kappaea frigidicola]